MSENLKGTLEVMRQTHFTDSIIYSHTYNNQEGTIERGTRPPPQEWHKSDNITTFNKFKWAIGIFGAFISQGFHKIFPTLRQQTTVK